MIIWVQHQIALYRGNHIQFLDQEVKEVCMAAPTGLHNIVCFVTSFYTQSHIFPDFAKHGEKKSLRSTFSIQGRLYHIPLTHVPLLFHHLNLLLPLLNFPSPYEFPRIFYLPSLSSEKGADRSRVRFFQAGGLAHSISPKNQKLDTDSFLVAQSASKQAVSNAVKPQSESNPKQQSTIRKGLSQQCEQQRSK